LGKGETPTTLAQRACTLSISSAISIIHQRKTCYVTYLTPKLCGAGAPNTAQDRNAGVRLRAEQINFLLAENKCYAFSLSLPGTAAALVRWQKYKPS